MNKSPWKLSAIALAASLALGLYASDASALALGRVTVQSALGEPFRAEIEVPEINADEASSLRAAVASATAFRTAGMELTPTIASVQISLQRRADGRYFLRLTSDRAVNEPFLDLVLEASWASGRVVRDYTMLFDPPNLRQGAPVATAQAPAVTRPSVVATPVAPRQAPTAPAPTTSSASALPSAPVARAPAARAEPTAAGRAPAGEGQRLTVQGGETAGRIAATHKPAAISLDQMLVAMLRANPEAFVGGNVNRLRAGAVLELPSAEQAGATEPREARQMLVAQSRDFNEFRRRLAEGAPMAAVAPADRQAGGRVQAQVEEKTPAAATPDKLTLSKGAVQGKAAADAIARTRAAQEAATRVAELDKNIAELNKLSAGGTTGAVVARPGAVGVATPGAGGVATPGAAGVANPGMGPAVVGATLPGPAAGTTAPAGSPATPAATVATPGATPAPAATVMPAAPAATPATATSAGAVTSPATAADGAVGAATAAPASAATVPASDATTSAPPAGDVALVPPPAAAAATTAKPALPAPASADSSLVDDLLQNPILVAAAGGLLTLLVGFGLFRSRQRKKANQVDSSFLESRTAPDSFFGASGGQRIDTAEGSNASGSSMVYSASQLDAAGDVDPVAEADVYLAYGRDLQAEEILKEALRTTPERVAVHSKLLEIYAKRREVKAFNKAAEEAFSLTRGQGPEWEHICTLGHEIDPANALYLPGGLPAGATQPTPAAVVPPAAGAAPAPATPVMPAAAAAIVAPAAAAALTPAAVSPPSAAVATAPVEVVPTPVPPGLDLDLDFDLGPPAAGSGLAASLPATAAGRDPAPGATSSLHSPTAGSASAGNDLDDLLTFDMADDAPADAPARSHVAPSDSGMIDFDLSSLSLDIDRASPRHSGDTDFAPAAALHGRPQADDVAVTAGFDMDAGEDPLVTKLALAEEFSAIGDPDGARSLAEEVRDEASGDLKGRAERFLAELS